MVISRLTLASGRRPRRGVRSGCKLVPVFQLSFPRRQQARRLRRAAASGAAAIVAGALATTPAVAGATPLAGLLALVMAALVVDARRWVRLAARSGAALGLKAQVGERSAGWRRGVAVAALAPLGWARGYRQCRDRPDLGSRSRSRPRRTRSTHATSPAPGRRPSGFTGIAGAGAVEERSRCCAWCAPAGSST